MAFIDRIQIKLASGHGGKGAVHFQKTRRSPRAGPDGGDGGTGGDLILSPKTSLTDFSHLNSRFFYKAEDGKPGRGGKKKGAQGKDLTVYVPEGTICYDSNGRFLEELRNENWRFLKGGKGGRGNYFFKNDSLQAPQIAQPGQPAVQKKVIMELKWVSDVCLIGYRGCGKTSLVFGLGQREEKIYPSSYPRLFSIQVPNYFSSVLFVDLPGLSPSTRKFLKQSERTKIIILVVSLADEKPFSSYEKLKEELLSYDQKYSSNLIQKISLLLLTGKKDFISIKKMKFFDKVSMRKISFFSIDDSSQIKELMDEVLKILAALSVSNLTKDCVANIRSRGNRESDE